jgi:hypothetical protein
MKKAKRFNGEDGSVVDDESEIIFDNRSVKEGKLPSETTAREAIVAEPVKRKPKAIVRKQVTETVVERPKPSFRTNREDVKTNIAKAMADEIKKNDSEKVQGSTSYKSPGSYVEPSMMDKVKRFGSRAMDKFSDLTRNTGGKSVSGATPRMASGGKVKSASSRADGCAIRGKTRA